MLREILFTSCFIDIFVLLKHRLSDYMRGEMFIHVYFMLKLEVEEGMITLTHALHCRLNSGTYQAFCHATSKKKMTLFERWDFLSYQK